MPSLDPRRTGLWPNTVVYESGRSRGCGSHVAPLSIHCSFEGRELYQTSEGRYTVTPGRYLVLNQGQTVSSFVARDTRVESLSVLFERSFAAGVLRALELSDGALLEAPEADDATPVVFFERTYPADAAVTRAMAALRSGPPAAAVEEQMHGLLAALLHAHRGVRREIDRVPALRASTRVELYRRLCRARDYLEASLDRPVLLFDLGRVACLAPHRLLRVFRDTFGETPHRYLTRRRLEHARALLETDVRVADVARAVGFESVGSFSTLFKRRFGASPRRLRGR